jgi:hypothetical protein
VSYASEVTPINLRGYLTTYIEALIVVSSADGRYVNLCWIVGQFIATGVLQGVSGRTDEWGFRVSVFQFRFTSPLQADPLCCSMGVADSALHNCNFGA